MTVRPTDFNRSYTCATEHRIGPLSVNSGVVRVPFFNWTAASENLMK